MRTKAIAVVLLGLGACSHDSIGFERQAELDAPTQGVGLFDQSRGFAGMYGMSCEFNAQTGEVSTDYKLTDSDDKVADARADQAVVIGVDQMVVFDREGSTSTLVEVEGIVDARLGPDGPVASTEQDGDCILVWPGGDYSTVASGSCGGLAAAPDGTVFVGVDGEVWSVDDEGSGSLGTAGDLVAWDEHAQALYVSAYGAQEVSALEADGAHRWTTEFDGHVTALSDMGSEAAASVGLETRNGSGEVWVLDGATGEVQGTQSADSAPTALSASPDGSTLAIVHADTIHLYQVSSVAY